MLFRSTRFGVAALSRDIRLALTLATESLDYDIRHGYRRRLTARAMIRSRVSSFAGNCLTTSPS
jgi:hypothetical protein